MCILGKILFILERRRYGEESYQVRQLSQIFLDIEFGMSIHYKSNKFLK